MQRLKINIDVLSATRGEREDMKRIDTLSEEAKAVYLKTIEMAKVYGVSEWECGILDCDICPFNENFNPCTVECSKEECIAWAEEEV